MKGGFSAIKANLLQIQIKSFIPVGKLVVGKVIIL